MFSEVPSTTATELPSTLLSTPPSEFHFDNPSIPFGTFNAAFEMDLGGEEFLLSALLESDILMAGFKQSIQTFLNNDAKCKNEFASFHSFQIDNEAPEKKLTVNGKCHGIEGNCLRALSDIKNEWTENHCGNLSLIDLFGDIVRDTASSIYDIQQELNLESLIPKIIAEERFDYTGIFEQVEGSGLDQIDSIIFGDPQLQDIEEKAMKEHSSLHQSQRAVIHIIFDHFNLLFNENATECSYDGINCDGDDVVTNIWLCKYLM